MAKKAIINREIKRNKLHQRYLAKRNDIKSKLSDPNISLEDKWKLRLQLQKLPKNSSPSRVSKRCFLTGRVHSVYSRFGLSRIKIREYGMKGEIPGLIKSSW